ncbi:MAG TPA: glycosyltransferase family 4 protein [Bacteroidota bacterium]|nr:glycosyltransferase family 4 protein [Bacteroidota bacterium]
MEETKSKRVGLVARLSDPGGVQSVALSLIRGLNQKGVIPDILWDVEPSWPMLEKAGVRAKFTHVPFRFSTTLIDRMPLSLRYLAWIINAVDGEQFRRQYDFVYTVNQVFYFPSDFPHLYYLSGPPLLPQLEMLPRGVKGVPIRFFKWMYRTFWRTSRPIFEYQRGGKYVINSHYTARLFKEAHGVDLPVVHPPIKISDRWFDHSDLSLRDSLVFFSRIVWYKRPYLVLELAKRHPNYRCVIMGGVQPHQQPYFEELQKKAATMGVKIEFIRNPSDQQVREELARAKFYIFPAVNEHFGMTTPEAIASGAIPFVHDSGGQIEIVIDERLRFSDSELHDKFDALMKLPDAELAQIRKKLVAHVQQYSEEAFWVKMFQHSGPGKSPSLTDVGDCQANNITSFAKG